MKGSAELEESVKNVENLVIVFLKDFPPMPTFVSRKGKKEVELDEARELVKKLNVTMDFVFASLLK